MRFLWTNVFITPDGLLTSMASLLSIFSLTGGILRATWNVSDVPCPNNTFFKVDTSHGKGTHGKLFGFLVSILNFSDISSIFCEAQLLHTHSPEAATKTTACRKSQECITCC